MPASSSNGETKDHSRVDSKSAETRRKSSQPSNVVDLTLSSSDEEPAWLEDHMHTVVDMIRPCAVHPMINKTSAHGGSQDEGTANRLQRRRFRHASTKVGGECASVSPFMHPSMEHALKSSSRDISPMVSRALGQSVPNSSPGTTARKFGTLPFMEFPPEIRNLVYRCLLTKPLTPIELPELTGRNGAAHRAQWAKCTTSTMKRKHKTIFLEILETCKQIHDEASGILYGCNIFKYRSNPGARSRRVVLPTRHLQLLKHIKISVISQGRLRNQDEQVADLVKQFVRDGLTLETFEITWWGEDRYRLRAGSPMCLALGNLIIQQHFVMKVAGQARMEEAMQDELERILLSKSSNITVEIHRPVKKHGEEPSDGSETDI